MKYSVIRIVVACLLVICLFGVLTFSGCGGGEPNPCKELHQVTADFNIYETRDFKLPDDYVFFDADTVASNYLIFEAAEEDATYEWTLGAETITTRSFTRNSFPRGKNIEVSLKVTKTPNTKCFPKDDGQDVVTRKFYTNTDFNCGSRINGSFKGHEVDDPNNERVVDIETCKPSPAKPDFVNVRLNNLVSGCEIVGFLDSFAGYKHLYFSGTTHCKEAAGIARIPLAYPDSINIEYEIDDANNPSLRVKKKFKGIRE
jgi:hypothetical protein